MPQHTTTPAVRVCADVDVPLLRSQRDALLAYQAFEGPQPSVEAVDGIICLLERLLDVAEGFAHPGKTPAHTAAAAADREKRARLEARLAVADQALTMIGRRHGVQALVDAFADASDAFEANAREYGKAGNETLVADQEVKAELAAERRLQTAAAAATSPDGGDIPF